MNRIEKLRRIKAKKEQARRLMAMYGTLDTKPKDLTTPVQEIRKNILLSTMMGNCRQ